MLNADKITDNHSNQAINCEPAQIAGGLSGMHLQDNRPKSVVQQKQVQALVNKGVVQPRKNTTGLPDKLKSGIENLSGIDVSDVKVHYNSDKPAQLNAHAYAQGTDIHVASGQEKHLPHEAWHVVQQKQGRVQPTLQMKQGVAVNNDKGLEQEADTMGAKANSVLPRTNRANLSSFEIDKNNAQIQAQFTNGAGGPVLKSLAAEIDNIFRGSPGYYVLIAEYRSFNNLLSHRDFIGWIEDKVRSFTLSVDKRSLYKTLLKDVRSNVYNAPAPSSSSSSPTPAPTRAPVTNPAYVKTEISNLLSSLADMATGTSFHTSGSPTHIGYKPIEASKAQTEYDEGSAIVARYRKRIDEGYADHALTVIPQGGGMFLKMDSYALTRELLTLKEIEEGYILYFKSKPASAKAVSGKKPVKETYSVAATKALLALLNSIKAPVHRPAPVPGLRAETALAAAASTAEERAEVIRVAAARAQAVRNAAAQAEAARAAQLRASLHKNIGIFIKILESGSIKINEEERILIGRLLGLILKKLG